MSCPWNGLTVSSKIFWDDIKALTFSGSLFQMAPYLHKAYCLLTRSSQSPKGGAREKMEGSGIASYALGIFVTLAFAKRLGEIPTVLSGSYAIFSWNSTLRLTNSHPTAFASICRYHGLILACFPVTLPKAPDKRQWNPPLLIDHLTVEFWLDRLTTVKSELSL